MCSSCQSSMHITWFWRTRSLHHYVRTWCVENQVEVELSWRWSSSSSWAEQKIKLMVELSWAEDEADGRVELKLKLIVELSWAEDGAHGDMYGQSLIMYIWYGLHTSPRGIWEIIVWWDPSYAENQSQISHEVSFIKCLVSCIGAIVLYIVLV
jgi:hypothetical protein